jgi:ATP-dependent Clp protease ATP-binding subunit ClpC
VFERFTERARRTLFFARYEASQFGAQTIGPEHLLLGIIQEGSGLLARVFARWHLSFDAVRQRVSSRVARAGMTPTHIEIPFTAEVQRILRSAETEANRLGHDAIGVEHLLLGLLEVRDAVAAAVLMEAGMEVNAVREEVSQLQREEPQASLAWSVGVSSVAETVAQLRDEIRELRARIERLEQRPGDRGS